MGKPVIRLGSDLTTGHQGYPPVPAVTASGNVFANKRGIVRTGDKYQMHTRPHGKPHVGVAIGSSTVRVNGKPAQLKGDSNSCKDKASHGSSNVRFG